MPKTTKQCGFVVAHNYDKGILLLEAYKKNKGTHYQLPGGNIDKDEIERYGIVEGARRAAARELWEETGIDMRNNIERLQQIPFPASHQTRLGRRLFFYLRVLNDESENIKLSHEHTNFCFEPSILVAAEKVNKHSGGKVKLALEFMADAEFQNISYSNKKIDNDDRKGQLPNNSITEEIVEHEDEMIDTTTADCCGFRFRCCNERKGAIKVDPKVYFANERTFLSWMHMAVTIGSIGGALLSFIESTTDGTEATPVSHIIGLSLMVVAICMIGWALFAFYHRSRLVRNRLDGPYALNAGPTVLTSVMVGAMSALIATHFINV